MKTVQGDLIELALDGVFDTIIHGCNCQCTMGAGIALAIKQIFPQAYAADRATGSIDRAKLGTISHATVERAGHSITIVNGYTQFHWRGQGVLADYDAIRSVMAAVRQIGMANSKRRICLSPSGSIMAPAPVADHAPGASQNQG